MEARILDAEARLEQGRTLAEDPAIGSNAALLESRTVELSAIQEEVDALYTRWAELEAKLASP